MDCDTMLLQSALVRQENMNRPQMHYMSLTRNKVVLSEFETDEIPCQQGIPMDGH